MSDPWTLTARWVFPVAGPPRERGTVTVREDRILAVGSRGERPADVDLGNAAVLPGLVNAHTHLDLSGLRGRVPPGPDFTGWLRAVIRHRRARAPGQILDDVRAGLAGCLAHGTTLVGDISAGGQSWPVLTAAPVWAVVFYELLGLPRERARRAWTAFLDSGHDLRREPTCRPGLSPHAPYSVSLRLLRQARRTGLPLAVHLAESAAELELLERHAGPFVPFLTELGVWDPGELARDLGTVLRATRRGRGPVLYVHGNFLDPGVTIPPHGTVVYCPRTHAAFGHPPHPFRSFLARGVRVALGTDSLASNPDLDLLAEARFLHEKFPDLDGAAILRMATLAGAEALGWQDEAGSLTPGKSADLAVVPLPDREAPDPHRLVLASRAPVKQVLFRGRWVHGPAPEGAQGVCKRPPVALNRPRAPRKTPRRRT